MHIRGRRNKVFTALAASAALAIPVAVTTLTMPAEAAVVVRTATNKPKITTQPKSLSVAAGAKARFVVKARSAKSYRWQYKKSGKWKSISKATGPRYAVRASSSLNGRKYRVRVTNGNRKVYSKSATLSVRRAKGTRASPYELGTNFRSGDWRFKFRSTNTNAWPEIRAENMFNDPPKSGHRYLMVRVAFGYFGRNIGTPWLGTSVDFVGKNGRVYSGDCGVIPHDMFEVDDLYPKAWASGNYCVMVPASQISGGAWRAKGDFDDYRSSPYKFNRQ